MHRFLDLADFSREEIVDLLRLARRLEQHPEPKALDGKVLGLLFMNPSLRTLSSFQSGMMRLGGSAFVVTPGQGTWQFETRDGAVMDGAAAEHLREAIPVLASYSDALGIRAFADGKDLAEDLAAGGKPLPHDGGALRQATGEHGVSSEPSLPGARRLEDHG